MLVTSAASADAPAEPVAATIDAEARAAYARKEFTEAARLFARAFRVEPHPATKYNEGRAWDQAGVRSAAADAFELALTLPGLDEGRTAIASRRLAELKVLVVTVEVTKPLGARVTTPSGDSYGIPARFHLDPGAHEIVVSGPSGNVKRIVTGEAGSVVQIVVDLPAPPLAVAKPAPIPDRVEPHSSRAAPLVAFGVGGALAVTSGVLGVLTLRARTDYVNLRGSERESAGDRFAVYKRWTNISLAAAGVAVTTGVILWISESSHDKQKPAVAALHIGPGSAAVTISF